MIEDGSDFDVLVDSGTINPNLTLIPSLNPHPSQLSDGGNKSVVESVLTGGKEVDGGLGPCVGEEDLVGGEEALALLEVLEVLIVEGLGSDRVHVDGDPGVHS